MAYQNPYHVAEDIYGSASWQQIVKDSDSGNPTGWYKNLTDYYYRAEWELFDIQNDPMQIERLLASKY